MILAVEKLLQKVKLELIRRHSSVDSLEKGVICSLEVTCRGSSYEFEKKTADRDIKNSETGRIVCQDCKQKKKFTARK